MMTVHVLKQTTNQYKLNAVSIFQWLLLFQFFKWQNSLATLSLFPFEVYEKKILAWFFFFFSELVSV